MVRAKFAGILLLFLMGMVLAGCSKRDDGSPYSAIPATGDAAHGKVLFASGANGAPACATCHSLDTLTLVGPGFAGLADRAATRVANESAREYVFYSITQPSRHIVSGFTNVMYAQYEAKLSKQDIADLIAYLLESPSGQ